MGYKKLMKSVAMIISPRLMQKLNRTLLIGTTVPAF